MADIASIIEMLENRWMRAWVAGDVRTLKSLTSRKFRLVMGSTACAILDFSSWLVAAESRFLCRSYRFGDIYSRQTGSVAIFATQLEMKATMDGEDWSGRYWVTDVWQKSRLRRGWRIVERVVSRPEENSAVPAAIRSLQLWRQPREKLPVSLTRLVKPQP